jgi:hypothetical protein
MRSIITTAAILAFVLPSTAFALEGIGPRVTVTGIVQEVRLTQKQAFDQEGGEVVIQATNGQMVTVVIAKETQIASEGKLSRKELIPANITTGMQVRVRGWRVDSKTLTASLFIIMNIEVNPVLSANGTIQGFDGSTVKVLTQNGSVQTYTVTNETEVNINYSLRGPEGITLIGKQVLLTLNPLDSTQIRIMRITGVSEVVRIKPTTVELKMRER